MSQTHVIIQKLDKRNGGGWIAVLKDGFKQLGHATILQKYHNAVEIAWFHVCQEYREKGLGDTLIRGIIEAFPDNDVYVWSVVDSAKGFWQKMMQKYDILKEE